MRSMNSEDNLRDLISSIVIKYNTDKNFYNQLAEEINEKIKISKIADLFNDNIKIEFFTKNELFWLIKSIYEITKDKDHKPEVFFTEGEITRFITTPIELEEEVVEMVFPYTLPTIENDQYTCARMPIAELVKYYLNGCIDYDKRLQRETKKVKLKGEGYAERIKTYGKNVKEIKEAILNNTFTPTEISLNILKGEIESDVEPYEYDKETLTLKIPVAKGIVVQIIDGYHRLKAMSEVLEEYPELKESNRVTKVNILYRDLVKAGGYIIQQSKGNKISPAKLKTLDTSDVTTGISNDLNTEGDTNTNLLFNKIGLENEDVNKLDKYTTIDILSKAIERHWTIDVKDLKQKRKIRQYLIDFFNEIISSYPDLFSNIKESRKKSALVQGIIFGGFIALAKKLENVSRWEDKLDSILESTDWSLDDKGMWKDLNITNLNLSVRQIKKLDSIFENLYKEEK